MVVPSAGSLQYLFKASTSDGTSPAAVLSSNHMVLKAWGTFDGATLTFFSVQPDSTQIPINDPSGNPISITSSSQYGISYYAANEQIVCVQSGSGGSTSINVTVQGTSGGF